jgi:hypothetical protein
VQYKLKEVVFADKLVIEGHSMFTRIVTIINEQLQYMDGSELVKHIIESTTNE